MKEWLYKATDSAASGEPRPSYDTTRDLAVKDGVLCRSVRDSKERHALIANVKNVKAGDILHLFYRQHSPDEVRTIGSFRVRDPGAARVEAALDLALVDDVDLAERLRVAYGVKPDERITAWRIEPAPESRTPAEDDPEVVKFLEQTPTLVEYHRHAPASDAVPKDRILTSVSAQLPVLPPPLRFFHGPLLVTIETWSDGTVVARFPAGRLFGEGHDDASALEALAERIAEFVEMHLWHAHAGKLGGTLAKQWAAVTAMIDVSAVRVPAEGAREVG